MATAPRTPLPTASTTVLRTLTVAAFVVILNETLLVNALPQLMESLQVDERAVQWLTTGFMLTLAVVIPTTGWLLRRLGTRSSFRVAMGLFLLGTTGCVLAPNLPLLLMGRVVQASGTAIMMPLLMTTLLGLVPPGARGRVMGNVTLTIAVAPAMGPAVSGLILRWLSWHWLFGLVLPIALTVTVVGLRALRVAQVPDPDGPRPRLDLLSVGLTAVGFGTLVYGLAETGGEAGRSSALVPAPVALGVGAVGLALFVWRQLSLQRGGEPEIAPTPEQNAVAGLMLRAMIQAAKADGKIDDSEKQRLLGQVGDLDESEKQFIREQMAAPVDVQGLAREVPKGLEQQVYLMSLMSIDFDNQNEARYLNDLAQAMGISREQVNAIHQQVGVQSLYA